MVLAQASHPDVLEADAKQIAEMARQTFDTYVATSFLFFND